MAPQMCDYLHMLQGLCSSQVLIVTLCIHAARGTMSHTGTHPGPRLIVLLQGAACSQELRDGSRKGIVQAETREGVGGQHIRDAHDADVGCRALSTSELSPRMTLCKTVGGEGHFSGLCRLWLHVCIQAKVCQFLQNPCMRIE